MRTNTFQGFPFSAIGIGCYALSGAYGPKDRDQIRAVIRRAYEAGVTFFDTADAYGDAEVFLGETLRPFRQAVKIATKVGVQEQGRPDLSAGTVQRACEKSLRNLGVERIDLYQIHFDDARTPVEETLGALEALVTAGKIERYGVGHLPAERVDTYCRLGRPLSILMELSAVSCDALHSLLPFCRAYPVGGIAFSVTGRGLLTGKVGPDTQFDPSDIRSIDPLFQRERRASALCVAQRLREIGARYGVTSTQTAIAWALAQPGIVCALTGPSTLAHLEENLGAAEWTFPAEELAGFNAFLDDTQAAILAEQLHSVRRILDEPLNADPRQAFTDLVYAIETSIVRGLAAEADLTPVFYRLFPLKKALDSASVTTMEQIQAEIKAICAPSLA